MKLVLVILTTLTLTACIHQPEWAPEAFKPECRDGSLWAKNGLGDEIELEDSWHECSKEVSK